MSTPRNENLSGKPTLGRYTILREVARSNDIVYEAVDPTINRRIALKELNIAPTLTGQARRERIERFFREGRAAGAMNHPNIVTIFEIGEDNGRLFIAMEFLEGQSLRDRLHTVGVMPLAEAVAVITALCDALSYAHERGVVHRDIKPDNVHILPGGQVKLTDFGIARILAEEQLTMAGQVFGTPSYMSPEQVTGNPLDGRTDQFSLGVLLYEMVTGRKPFTGDTVVTITYRIIHEPMPVPAGVPAAVAKGMERALEKRPEMRFASTTEFKNALVSALELSRTGGFQAQPYGMPMQQAPAYGTMPGAPMTQPYAAGRTANPNATVMYGTQTQANPMGNAAAPVMAANPTQYPTTAPDDRRSRGGNFGTVAIAAVVLIGVIAGAGFALKGAFSNMRAGQSREQLVKIANQGVALYNKKEYEEAAALFKQVRLAGTNVDATTRQNAATNETVCYRMLGQRAQDAGDLPTAEMYFTKALEVSPMDLNAQTELAGIRKRRGTEAGTGLPVASDSSKPGGVTSDNPLASLLQPTPGPSDDPSSNTTLASPSPNGILPGSQTTADFNNRNQHAGSDAQTLLNKGDAAFNAGQQSEALDLWRQAMAAGPGSPASFQAQQRIAKYGSESVANPGT